MRNPDFRVADDIAGDIARAGTRLAGALLSCRPRRICPGRALLGAKQALCQVPC